MTIQQTLNRLHNIKPLKIGETPVIVLPLKKWEIVENILEDYEMMSSVAYRRSIENARKLVKKGRFYDLNFKTGVFQKVSRGK